MKREDKKFCFVSVVPKYLNLATFSNDSLAGSVLSSDDET
jgi:hypothetical protein